MICVVEVGTCQDVRHVDSACCPWPAALRLLMWVQWISLSLFSTRYVAWCVGTCSGISKHILFFGISIVHLFLICQSWDHTMPLTCLLGTALELTCPLDVDWLVGCKQHVQWSIFFRFTSMGALQSWVKIWVIVFCETAEPAANSSGRHHTSDMQLSQSRRLSPTSWGGENWEMPLLPKGCCVNQSDCWWNVHNSCTVIQARLGIWKQGTTIWIHRVCNNCPWTQWSVIIFRVLGCDILTTIGVQQIDSYMCSFETSSIL